MKFTLYCVKVTMNKHHHINHRSKPKRNKRFLLIAVPGVILVLILFRVFLPRLILNYSNRQLNQMKEYTGSVKDIDMHLYRGAVVIKDLVIDKTDEDGRKDTVPFVAIPRIDASIDWNALFKGKVVAKMMILEPVINYTNDIHADKELKQDTADFRELIRDLMPLTINRFEVRDGQLHYIDQSLQPPIDISMRDIYVVAANLSNVSDSNDMLPAHVSAAAGMYDGSFNLTVDLDPLKKTPTFEMQTELKNMDLVPLNDLFKTYGNIAIEEGNFSVFAEFAGKEGEFGGYVKPFINDFKVKKYKEDDDLGQRLWELLVGSAMKVLENPKSDQVATKVPVKGEFVDTEIETWDAIHYMLRNAFVQSLRPAIENTISVNNMNADTKETFLEKVFDGSDKKKEKKEK
jgi:Domain of Unknown Function (DUF748)